jgi:flavin prenyltransferase
MDRFLICITGSSGSAYAIRLLRALSETSCEIDLIVSEWGERVVREETGAPIGKWLERIGETRFNVFPPDDLSADPASGSYPVSGTVIVPCSTGTLGALASGNCRNLIHRAGAVALKEGRKLVLVPRETPLSLIDLRNLVSLREAGATILPASPGFYHCPKSLEDLVDQVVGKILDQLDIPNELFRRWGG